MSPWGLEGVREAHRRGGGARLGRRGGQTSSKRVSGRVWEDGGGRRAFGQKVECTQGVETGNSWELSGWESVNWRMSGDRPVRS